MSRHVGWFSCLCAPSVQRNRWWARLHAHVLPRKPFGCFPELDTYKMWIIDLFSGGLAKPLVLCAAYESVYNARFGRTSQRGREVCSTESLRASKKDDWFLRCERLVVAESLIRTRTCSACIPSPTRLEKSNRRRCLTGYNGVLVHDGFRN